MCAQTRLKELKAEEAAEEAQRLADAKRLKAYQQRQVQQRTRRGAAEKLAALQEAAQMQASMEEQDRVFEEYAAECMHEYKSQGKTTLPMELLLSRKPGFEVLI